MIEEFTGVRCSNCPNGAIVLKNIQTANAPRVLVAKAHVGNYGIPIKTDLDLRNPDATTLSSSLGMQTQPSAAVDRQLNTGTDYTFSINQVSGKVISQLAKPTPVNISLEKLVNATLDTINLAATFIFTDTTSRKLAFNIYLLENKVVTHQDSFDVVKV